MLKSRLRLALFVSLAFLNSTLPIEAQEPGQPPALTQLPAISQAIHNALQSRDFAKAVEVLDAEISRPDAKAVDYLLYLKARAQTELKQYPEAEDIFQQIEQDYPNSTWISRARFGRAHLHVLQQDYEAAGKIYQAEAERLLSRDRKDELAQIYLEFADRYYEGIPAKDPSQAKKPDYQQALTYYQEALKLGPTEQLEEKVRFRIASCLDKLNNANEAISAYREYLKSYADKEIENDAERQLRLAEVPYRLGVVYLNSGQRPLARKSWQDFLRKWQDGDPSPEIKEFLAKANYKIAHSWGVPQPNNVSDLELGIAAARDFLKHWPDHKLAPKAELEIAQSYSHFGRYTQAVEVLTALIANPEYNDSDQIPVARQLLGQAYLAQQKFDEAIATWKEFLEKHPTNSQWSAVQKRVIDTEYAKAEYARSQKNYDEAAQLWQTFLNKYPLDPRAASISFQFGQMKYSAGLQKHLDRISAAIDRGDSPQSVEMNDECKALFEEAIANWRRLVSKYPGTNQASQAGFMIGVTLEDRLGRLKAALEEYKKVSNQYHSQAQKRITRLTTPQLEISTERKFHSDEQPRIKLVTRNLEEVTVKVYRIDMMDYFRKMHLASGVETLDIALIDPDEDFVHEIPDYEEYRRTIGDVEIPIGDPGVTAVTVSSDKLEATTMVVVSDLDIIFKSSRNELFLFAENMRTGQPVEGVSILISDGSEVFAQEVTGKDGILQKTYDKLKKVADLRVFAVHEGHVASSVANLNGLDFAVGLSPKGYLFTDRPVYRSGQLVNLKGIVRWVDQDLFTFKPGEKFKLEVFDARSRLIHSSEVALNGYGTIHDNLLLPATAVQGQYRVRLHRKKQTEPADGVPELSFETTFEVAEYKLEPVRLSVDLKKDVYFRGDEVSGKISLKYYYGLPLVGEEIHYQFGPDGETRVGKTDEEGQLEFTFETAQYNESQPLMLTVNYPARGMQTARTVYLATRGFEIAASTLRDVYITGESFDAKFKVTSPAGKPVETKLKVEVFQQTRLDNGQKGEKLISTHEVTTNQESGEALQNLQLEEAGRYIVRATATDQFENEVTGQTALHMSGKKDSVRLRILADRHYFDVGDDAQIRVHWREQPALALVTFEGASILGYQLVRLETGDNTISVPMESHLAPNFNFSVAVMHQHQFHTAVSEFRVSQKLNIKLALDGEELKPGDPLTVNIEVTDPQGNPVQAEVALSLVQTNLLQMFSEVQGAIDTFFSQGERTPSLRQFSSCTFKYRPQTRGISQYLLAESQRLRVLEREMRALSDLSLELESRVAGVDESSAMDAYANGEVAGRATSGSGVAGNIDFDSNGNGEFVELEALNQLSRALQEGEVDGVVAGDVITNWKALQRQAGRFNKLQIQESQQSLGLQRRIIRNATPGAQNRYLYQLNAVDSGFSNRGLSGTAENLDTKSWAELLDRRSGSKNWFSLRGNANSALPAFHRPNLALGSIPLNNSDAGVILFSDGTANRQQLGGENAIPWSYFAQRDVTVNGITKDGRFLALNGREQEEIQQLVEEGVNLLPGMTHAETGFWDPTIVTDVNGKASVIVTMPAKSTSWKVRAKGINDTSLAGHAEESVLTKKDLFAEMKLPTAFTTGDKATVPVEVHNSLEGAREIKVTLQMKIGDKTTSETNTMDVQGPGVSKLEFPVTASGESVEFQLEVASGDLTDITQQTLPVHPDGFPVYATASGTSEQSTLAFVGFEAEQKAQDPSLEIVIGPNVNRSLIDAVLGTGGILIRCGIPQTSGTERATSEVLGGLAVLEMLGLSKDSDSPEAATISSRIHSSLLLLISAQRDDGSWSWSGLPDRGEPDRFLTARVMWALAEARKAGFTVGNDQFNKGETFLKSAFANSSPSDLEGQTILLHAMAECGCADFAFANRLFRERNRMSDSGLVHLALALAAIDHEEMAKELMPLVDIESDSKTANRLSEQRIASKVPWMSSGIELRGLYLLALEQVDPNNAEVARLADWLLAARVGSRWPVEKANGPVIQALAKWSGRTRRIGEEYTLTVEVNGKPVETMTIDPSQEGSRRLSVPSDLLSDDKPQQISFQLDGRGSFTYSAVLTGFVATENLKSTTRDWVVSRRYEPHLRKYKGKDVQRGFSIVEGGYKSFTNPLTQLPVGVDGYVTLKPRRYNVTGQPDEQYDYLVITEPIPAGCTIPEDSISGQFERYEIEPGLITFYVGDRRYPQDITYRLVGYVPGEYRARPTIVRSFYDPQQIAVGGPVELTVLHAGEDSNDEYRPTPDELYNFGRLQLADKDHEAAHKSLTDLFNNWRLRNDRYKDVVNMLFQTSLAIESHGEIVKYFEIIKEKFADIEVRFEDILKVALSYRELGEYERSYLVYRATVQGSFERESQVAGFLNARGEFFRSVQVLEELFRDYPAESYLATSTYALAQEVYRKAPQAKDDPKLKEAGLTRVHLIDNAIHMLDHFVTTFPDDPAADQASFATASALLDLDKYQAAIDRCEAYAVRYSDSRLLDSFWYIIGYSHFELGEHQAALDMCEKVAEAKFPVPETGGTRPADNKWEAIYIMGQVYHALGKASKAIDEYSKVKTRFPDASETIDFFTHKDISLDEVTAVKPVDERKLKLHYRNIAEVSLKVYRIDLMKFGLMQRNLNRITAINLAGIKPYHEETVELGDGKDYRDMDRDLELPLKEEGAYLVVCRGDNLYASGLMLVSPLTLEVQEDATSGRVRVTIKDATEDAFQADVHVKVIGSANEEFRSGETDLRGLFIADDIRGTSTIIARAGDNLYAFHRGKTVLQNVAPNAAAQQEAAEEAEPAGEKVLKGKQLLRGNIESRNGFFQKEQQQNYDKLLNNSRKGLMPAEAY
jgi:uncharacterized protein YfaS (alpha-2-macroglobulin family)